MARLTITKGVMLFSLLYLNNVLILNAVSTKGTNEEEKFPITGKGAGGGGAGGDASMGVAEMVDTSTEAN
ncbi:hypothetical protein COLO4_15702 [Corchorus olitorius]|uniref:Uncharacterized protein n=1 Tax=Corchorus olitorius TaxID=93759 RepID=A0A1R3JLK2_9ROSI|nr:hypothetical protein COLO4_15702 [Corchorus olitorius]